MATLSLHHPFHPHALELWELSQNCTARCVLCALAFCGSTYCCLDCDIYLHESCANLPLQIQHPSHPEHSLNLSWYCLKQSYDCHGCGNSSIDFFMYCCDDCMFTLDITCAVSTLPPPGGHRDEEIIQHFAHDHPLALFHVDKNIRLTCKACEWKISGPTYGCGRCFFMLHESCAQLPREIPQHPLHNNHHALTLLVNSGEVFQCKACEQHDPLTYRYNCSECEFNLCVRCAVATLPLQDQQREDSMMIQHISHSHKLTYFSVAMDSDICCKVCHKKISGEVYGCTDCIFFLHKPCAELPQKMVHSLHPHTLYLKERSYPDSNCWFCCEKLSSSFYDCPSCLFQLDIGCTSFKLNNYHAALEDGVSLEIHDPFHQDPLFLHYFTWPYIFQCKACQYPVRGLGYLSKEDKQSLPHTFELFGYCLHISCAGLPRELEHPCHPKHPLKLTESDRSFTCDACNRESKGYAFSCDECRFHLDVDCASRKPSLKHQLHEHELTYFQRTEYLRCNRCGKKCDRNLYRCVDCNFNLHHGCVPLPPSAQHELHPHPLLLRDRVVDETYDEHYCDLCETLRNPDHGVYYCEDCNWAVHICCIIPIAESKGNIEVQKPMPKLDEEITSLEADIQKMSMKLKELKRMRADMISPSSMCEGDVEELDALEIKLPAYPSEKTHEALMRIQQNGDSSPRARLKYPPLSTYTLYSVGTDNPNPITFGVIMIS